MATYKLYSGEDHVGIFDEENVEDAKKVARGIHAIWPGENTKLVAGGKCVFLIKGTPQCS